MPISIPALLYYVPTPLPSLSRDPVLFLIHPGRRLLFLLRVSRRHHESLGRQSERCLTWTWTDQLDQLPWFTTTLCLLLAHIQAVVQQQQNPPALSCSQADHYSRSLPRFFFIFELISQNT